MISNPPPWPNGARCAASITFDMDADSILHLEHRDSHRRVSAISMLRYGPDVAIPRILETYRKFGIKQTFYIPAWCIEQYPHTVELIVEAGHEIGHHGYIHENPHERSPEEELYWLRRGIDVIEKHTGQRPRGWRAPLYNFSDASADLLIEEGFLYDASLMDDDIPYVLETSKGRLLELPSHWGVDDWPPYVHSIDLDYVMPIRDPKVAIQGFRTELEAAREFGGLWVPVWHPFASGRLARWWQVEKLIEEFVGYGDVWFAPMEEIAQHIADCIANGSFKPRVDHLPFYDGPVEISKKEGGS